MIETLLVIYLSVVAFIAVGGAIVGIVDWFRAPPADPQ